ncbi:beta-lactamase regulating signal transducer with metallopeptidase domain [Dyadobacter sp. BE34]|uniref:Beta-lactamase regulating signal transducer with metallopeptidase domain n=1 Tax=Dyadobacter fermentans TaxID=94254 RepID=A0ABU1QUV1_9BACT|nr:MULTISPECIES: M56 family metallopeptidase [Dyadobacter]MDR6804921.1 beta-lactamase regulating signal transducer with metallopeptidase domain [Dyadobacter fermentans]MDR7043320.1 beta-lactamase regulating signal transducer with metallopeptidase domain [Dyadobacter sp. BE242]MDR7197632.1 beta-lactamase regulating signal transducer with metallopeptidase domain [Dyadobacter sp. BE34]MDR7214935.1 beta-lactamase regulating signal transducer with metallopeptidase domain [Dyadobacter sp. BE31]MDR72
MKNLLTSETTYALIRQIGVALGHSLWIGAATALLAAAVVVCTRRSRPEIRYNLLTGLLLLFIAGTAVAFVQSGSDVSAETQVPPAPATHVANDAVVSVQATSRTQTVFSIATGFLIQNVYAITWLWLAVVIAKISGLTLGLYRLHQLKTQQIYSIGRHWERRVGEFAQTLGVAQHVKIFQSGLVKVPTVLGHFRPVILVPLGVITSIPADQIEMVLLHELAHIRRLDFFVNFLQRLTELLFFFNPGILWISRLIHEERENCCDDMALRHSGNQAIYIRALLSFREYQLNEDVYQLAFSGKGGLVQRAKRIASRTNSTLGAAEKTVLLVAMLAFFTFSVLFAQSGGLQTGPQKTNAKQARRTGHTQNPAAASKNETFRHQAPNKSNNTNNQIINKPNTQPKQSIQNPAGVANYPNLTPPDTLQPLQKTMGPLNRLSAPLAIDSSANARLAPVQWQPYAQTYKAQPLQTYRHEYRPNPVRLKRQAINEKILDAIEQQGIEISRNNIDFRITNHELIVNGVKQPESVLKSVLDAVLPKPDDVIDFTYGSHH